MNHHFHILAYILEKFLQMFTSRHEQEYSLQQFVTIFRKKLKVCNKRIDLKNFDLLDKMVQITVVKVNEPALPISTR